MTNKDIETINKTVQIETKEYRCLKCGVEFNSIHDAEWHVERCDSDRRQLMMDAIDKWVTYESNRCGDIYTYVGIATSYSEDYFRLSCKGACMSKYGSTFDDYFRVDISDDFHIIDESDAFAIIRDCTMEHLNNCVKIIKKQPDDSDF